jgi:hypothetical protein
MRRTALALVWVITLAACTTDRTIGGPDGATADGARDQGDKDQRLSSVCPQALPGPGDSCTRDGLICQYGNDPRRECRPTARCDNKIWQVTDPGCKQPPKETCPPTREDAASKNCSIRDAYCTYPGDLVCRCTNCIAYPVPRCQGPLTWHCDVPNQDKKCPPGKPNLGAACSREGQRCEYHCGQDGVRICNKLVWTPADGTPCPVSTRRAKRAVSYLSPAEVDAVARRLLDFRLATYRYRDPALGRGRHLGFILEDTGRSYAGDPGQGQVNLYGYSSMLLATVQAQQRAIRQLRRQLRGLRAELRRLGSHRPKTSRSHRPKTSRAPRADQLPN